IGVVFRHNRDCKVILVKLCKFLAHPLNGHFKKLIPKRFLMSRTKRSRIAIIHLQKSLPFSNSCITDNEKCCGNREKELQGCFIVIATQNNTGQKTCNAITIFLVFHMPKHTTV
uniref:Uncharacterized protein n=1 Tax=Haplochromis burtoni TaxID=8153 RepID=A0A3Q2VB51_HAPBU